MSNKTILCGLAELLCVAVADNSSTGTDIEITDIHIDGKDLGDWEVLVRKVEKPSNTEDDPSYRLVVEFKDLAIDEHFFVEDLEFVKKKVCYAIRKGGTGYIEFHPERKVHIDDPTND